MNRKIRLLLEELYKTSDVFWNVSKETGAFLYLVVKINKPENILEIGTSNGVSTIWMASALSKKAHIYTIESNKRLRFPEAQKNFAKAGLSSSITQILGHAPEAIPKKPQFFDLIFLDATKYEHTDYLDALLSRTREKSIIITDNAISHEKELAPYTKKIKSLKNFKTHLLPIGTGLLISTRQIA